MIVIVKRDDLSEEHRNLGVHDVRLDHTGISPDLIEEAELIVFVEGTQIQFLKNLPGIQSKASFEVLLRYIISIEATPHRPYNKKRVVHRKKSTK